MEECPDVEADPTALTLGKTHAMNACATLSPTLLPHRFDAGPLSAIASTPWAAPLPRFEARVQACDRRRG